MIRPIAVVVRRRIGKAGKLAAACQSNLCRISLRTDDDLPHLASWWQTFDRGVAKLYREGGQANFCLFTWIF